MLKREECRAAISRWNEVRTNYTEIERLFNPSYTFRLDSVQRNWIKENNDNKSFHTYMGVHNDQVVLIVVPLNRDGKEVVLESYVSTNLQGLTDDLKIIEEERTVKRKITKLSSSLDVVSYKEVINYSVENEPQIDEKTSVKEIEAWKNDCLDWFYHECSDFNGQRIFRTFEVPFADLEFANRDIDELVCLFAFKNSDIYRREIPVLIFIGIDVDKNSSLLRSDNGETGLESPVDFSSPNPPFKRTEPDYELLK